MSELYEPTRVLLFFTKKVLEAGRGSFLIGHRGAGKTTLIRAFGQYFERRGYDVRLLGGGNLTSIAEAIQGEYSRLFIGVPEAGSRTDYALEKFLSIAAQLITDHEVPKMRLRDTVLYIKVRETVAVAFPIQFKLFDRIIRNSSRHNLAQDRFVFTLMTNPPNRQLLAQGDDAVLNAMVQSLESREPQHSSPVLTVDDLELLLQLLGLSQNRAFRLARAIGELRGEAAARLTTTAYVMGIFMPSDFLAEDSPGYRVRLSTALLLDALIHDPRSMDDEGRVRTNYLLLKFRTTPKTLYSALDYIADRSTGVLRKESTLAGKKYFAEPLLLRLAGRRSFADSDVQNALKRITGERYGVPKALKGCS